MFRVVLFLIVWNRKQPKYLSVDGGGRGVRGEQKDWGMVCFNYLVIKKGNAVEKNIALIDSFAALLEDTCTESWAFVNRMIYMPFHVQTRRGWVQAKIHWDHGDWWHHWPMCLLTSRPPLRGVNTSPPSTILPGASRASVRRTARFHFHFLFLFFCWRNIRFAGSQRSGYQSAHLPTMAVFVGN